MISNKLLLDRTSFKPDLDNIFKNKRKNKRDVFDNMNKRYCFNGEYDMILAARKDRDSKKKRKICYHVCNTDFLDDEQKLKRNIKKLENISVFTYRSNQGKIIHAKELSSVISAILPRLLHQPDIYPDLSGNILLAFENDEKKKYLQIYITSDKRMHIYRRDESVKHKLECSDIDVELINKEIEKIYK